jgi:hypothetical protein
MMKSYLFFEDFLLDFFAAFFFVAIRTHHLSCRTGPPGRAYLAKIAGSLRPTWRTVEVGEGREPNADDHRHRLKCMSSFW